MFFIFTARVYARQAATGKGDWPMIELHHTGPDSGRLTVLSFRTVETALRHKRSAGLGPQTRIVSLRPAEDPIGQHDRFAILGERLRDGFLAAWWRAQLDRLVAREVCSLPDNLADGLALETAEACERELWRAGVAGWSARSGVYHHPDTGVIPTRVTTSSPIPHAWLLHDSGVILDITGLVMDRAPIAVLTPQDDRFTSFLDVEAAESALRRQEGRWMGSVEDDLQRDLVHLGAFLAPAGAIDDAATPA